MWLPVLEVFDVTKVLIGCLNAANPKYGIVTKLYFIKCVTLCSLHRLSSQAII